LQPDGRSRKQRISVLNHIREDPQETQACTFTQGNVNKANLQVNHADRELEAKGSATCSKDATFARQDFPASDSSLVAMASHIPLRG
jgi:hypothetical protein